MTKIYAYYLPQFHRTKENDEWWGEGFTDWTAVQKATPLFEGHIQPKRPLSFYNLLEKETMLNQAMMMKRYGIDGMCFYHYYFENGRKILEKPAENLLKWKDVAMPFCFYWANQSWAKTWSNVNDANVWTVDSANGENSENKSGILLKQNYGNKKDWLEHIDYLFPFFCDERYIKISGRPLFLIYLPKDIDCFAEMKACWDQFMDNHNMPRVFFVAKNTYDELYDGYMEHEPQHVMQNKGNMKYDNPYSVAQVYDYEELWKEILESKEKGENYFYGGFVGYDDTPRRGRSGSVVLGQSPELFKKYLIQLMIKANNSKNNIIFINAWNEWGEGMYLEPDKSYAYKYLEAIKEAKEFVYKNEFLFKGMNIAKSSTESDEKIEQLVTKNERYESYWKILRDLLSLELEGKKISKYLHNHSIQSCAIYGVGIIGKPIYSMLRKEGVNIAYCIDKDVNKREQIDVPLKTPDEELDDVDLVVIATTYSHEEIKRIISNRIKTQIITVGQLLKEAKM